MCDYLLFEVQQVVQFQLFSSIIGISFQNQCLLIAVIFFNCTGAALESWLTKQLFLEIALIQYQCQLIAVFCANYTATALLLWMCESLVFEIEVVQQFLLGLPSIVEELLQTAEGKTNEKCINEATTENEKKDVKFTQNRGFLARDLVTRGLSSDYTSPRVNNDEQLCVANLMYPVSDPNRIPIPFEEVSTSLARGGKLEAIEDLTSGVFSVVISDYRSTIVSVSDYKTKTSEHIVAPLQGDSDNVTSVAIISDRCLILSGPSDKIVRLWDAKTGSNRYTIRLSISIFHYQLV